MLNFWGYPPENGWLEDDLFSLKLFLFWTFVHFLEVYVFSFFVGSLSIRTMEPAQLIFVASLLNVNCLVGIELQKTKQEGLF